MSYKLIEQKDNFEKIRDEIIEENEKGPETFYKNIEDILMKTIEEMDINHLQEITYKLFTQINIIFKESELAELTGIKNCLGWNIKRIETRYCEVILKKLKDKYINHTWFEISNVLIENTQKDLEFGIILKGLDIKNKNKIQYERVTDQNYQIHVNPKNNRQVIQTKPNLFYNTFIHIIYLLGHPATSNLILLFISYLYY